MVQAARTALEQHELELDGASSALEAAEQELNEVPWVHVPSKSLREAKARSDIRLAEMQHKEEKKVQEMLLLVRDSIITFYKKPLHRDGSGRNLKLRPGSTSCRRAWRQVGACPHRRG